MFDYSNEVGREVMEFGNYLLYIVFCKNNDRKGYSIVWLSLSLIYNVIS